MADTMDLGKAGGGRAGTQRYVIGIGHKALCPATKRIWDASCLHACLPACLRRARGGPALLRMLRGARVGARARAHVSRARVQS